MEELTERQQTILGIVVRKYIAGVTPVASKAIAESYELGVSPATIRNDMAVLEERGYLFHPHTSAGRVPTERGYRYFVEYLMREVELPLAEQHMIRHQFHQLQLSLEQWMKLSVSILARTARSAALVTAPTTSRCRFRRLELIGLHETLVLVVLILQEGAVRQQLLTAAQPPLSQEELDRMASRINRALENVHRDKVRAKFSHPSPFEEEVLDCVENLMRQVDMQTSHEVYRNGLVHMLRQPEFAEAERLEEAIRILEERTLVDMFLSQGLPQEGVQVVIGGEGGWEEMSDYSIVLARYGLVDEALGVLGVLGPLRMPYGRAIPAVRYISELMSNLVQGLHGHRSC